MENMDDSEKNHRVTCPVCKKVFENQFALDGHLRLTMNNDHVAFRQQNETVANTANPVIPATPRFSGNKIIGTIETWVKNQEHVYGEEARTNALIARLNEMVDGEREIEQQYNDLIDSEKEMLSQERKKIEAEVWQQFQQEVNNAVAQEKAKWEQDHQEELRVARWERKKEDIVIGYNAALFWIPPTSSNGTYLAVPPGSPFQSYLIRLLNYTWINHPKETYLVFQQQFKFLKDNNVTVKVSIL